MESNCKNCLTQLNVLFEGFIFWLKWIQDKQDKNGNTISRTIQRSMILRIAKSMIVMLKDNNEEYQNAVKSFDINNKDIMRFRELLEVINSHIDDFEKYALENGLIKKIIDEEI